MIVTLYTSIYSREPYYLDHKEVLDLIAKGGKSRKTIEQLRLSDLSDDHIDEIKRTKLPIILWSGKFDGRTADSLSEYSYLICLDFDDLPDPDKFKRYLKTKPFVYAAFISPTGTGCKALVKVKTENHEGHFRALIAEFNGTIDESGKDVSRCCFLSYDPDLYVNESADIYDKCLLESYSNKQKYELLKKWLSNKGSNFVEGQRNVFISRLAAACNRFGIEKDFVINNVERDYVKGSNFSIQEARRVIEGVYKRYADQFNSVSFGNVMLDNKSFVDEILSTTVETNDVIYLIDVKDDLIKDYDVGTQKGETTHFPTIDPIFRWVRGDLNVLGGIGNYGKSAIQKQLDVVRAALEGKKFAYYSREEYPPIYWYRELIRTLVGKPLEHDDPMRMTKQEYERAMEFVSEHFFYIYPPKLPTPQYMLERYAETIIKHSVDGVVADPWNQFLHVMDKRDDIYLAETLTEIETFLHIMNVYGVIIAHPNRTSKRTDGNYECPDVYDFNGGAVWNARATNILIFHRPYYQTDKTDPTCEFHSKRIKKQMICGIPGIAVLTYNRRTGRFYDVNGFNPLDNFKL